VGRRFRTAGSIAFAMELAKQQSHKLTRQAVNLLNIPNIVVIHTRFNLKSSYKEKSSK